jgi:hypothetical protein
MLESINTIDLHMGLDNLSVDPNGDIWVPGFPDIWSVIGWMANPLEENALSTIFRIRMAEGWKKDGLRAAEYAQAEYAVDKMLEDREAKVVGGITTARHDVKTGRLFLGSKLFNDGVLQNLLIRCRCVQRWHCGLQTPIRADLAVQRLARRVSIIYLSRQNRMYKLTATVLHI